MTFYRTPARVAGPFGHTLRDLSALTPGERDTLRRELDALDTKLQWGFEPGRWARGAAWHGDDWPEPKLLEAGSFAGLLDRRDDLIAEAEDFRSTLDEADKVWKTEAGRNSPFLPVFASLPRHEQERVREQSKKFRELIAFGVTPDRWRSAIGYLRDDGHLLNPETDTERLMGMWENREDLLPHLDQTDYALDLLGELEKEGGAESADVAAQPVAIVADNAGSPTEFETEVEDTPTTSTGKLDETRFVTGQIYPMPDGTSWQWNGRELVQMRPGGGVVNSPFSDKWAAKGWGGPRGPYQVPTLNLEQDRIENILADKPARFEIKVNPKADDNDPWQYPLISQYATNKVTEHSATIEQLAKEHDVDPELVKAIMYREQAAGPVQPFADILGQGDTISPMGFNPEIWGGLGIDRAAASKSKENIRAAIILIQRIQDRIDDPTPEKIATLYNGLMRENVNDYGARVGRYYKEKPWLQEDFNDSNP